MPRSSPGRDRSDPSRAGIEAVAVSVGCLVFGLVAVLRAQDNGYDLRYYHYYLPYALLNDRIHLDYAPAQLQSYLNPLSFVPFYLLANHTPATVTAFVLGAWHGLTFGLVFALARALLGTGSPGARNGTALLCAVLGTCGPVFLGTLGGSSNDIPIAQLVLLALLWIARGWQGVQPGREHRSRALLASGLVLGMAVGLKMAAAAHVAAVAVCLVALPMSWRSLLRVGTASAAMFAVGLLITSGHWMVVLWERFASPTFPFFNAVFRSPYYPEVNFADRRFLPRDFAEAAIYPLLIAVARHREAVASEVRDARYAVLWVLGLGALLRYEVTWIRGKVGARRVHREARDVPTTAPTVPVQERWFLLFFAAAYVLWQSLFGIVRYAAPLEATAPIAVVLLARRLVRRSKVRGLVVALSGVAMLSLGRPIQTDRLVRRPHRFIEVQAPRFEHPEQVLVVVTHNAPWSFVLPFLQPEIRVLGLLSNLTKPWEKTRLQAEMRDVLDKHSGDIYLLTDQGYIEFDLGVLREHYGLEPGDAPCHRVSTRHQSIPIVLCPVLRRAP